MTPAEALKRARNLISKPEMLFSEREGREIMQGLVAAIEKSHCYMRAVEENREVFVLSSSDVCAPDAIRHWVTLAAKSGCVAFSKLDQAMVMANSFETCVTRKVPD